MSPKEHLHKEACMLSVKEHNEFFSRQFLLGCFSRNHTSSHRFETASQEHQEFISAIIDEIQHFID